MAGSSTREVKKYDLALADYYRALEINTITRLVISAAAWSIASRTTPMPAFKNFNEAMRSNPTIGGPSQSRPALSDAEAAQVRDRGLHHRGGLASQEGEPRVARGLSYMAINDFEAASKDLDDAVQADPDNLQAWVSRGLAYERLGDKQKAAGSYARALNLRRDYEAGEGRVHARRRPRGTELPDVLIVGAGIDWLSRQRRRAYSISGRT